VESEGPKIFTMKDRKDDEEVVSFCFIRIVVCFVTFCKPASLAQDQRVLPSAATELSALFEMLIDKALIAR
jgi:hypothetical protein